MGPINDDCLSWILEMVRREPREQKWRSLYLRTLMMSCTSRTKSEGYRQVWNGQFDQESAVPVCDGDAVMIWRNCFVDVVSCEMSEWMKRGKEFTAEHPLLRYVCITDKKPFSQKDLVGDVTVYRGCWALDSCWPDPYFKEILGFPTPKSATVPHAIYALMLDITEKRRVAGGPVSTDDAAMAILSESCLEYAKCSKDRMVRAFDALRADRETRPMGA